MQYRRLGHSGLNVSVLGMGTGGFTGGRESPFGALDAPQARALVDQCLDAGMNLLDTADVYNDGVAEEILGEVLVGRRDEVVLATKLRFSASSGTNEEGLSRKYLLRAADASLRRLRTDYIDIYQMHGWDGLTPVEETLEALQTLVQAGKVRYVGASNFSGWHLMKMLGAAERTGLPRLVSEQIHYTPHSREAELELIPIAGSTRGSGVLVWGPIAGGLLSGKFRRNQPPPPGTRHAGDYDEPPVYDEERLYDIVEVLVEIANDHGVSAAQVTLAYTLTRPAVTALIVGVRHDRQLADNLAGAELALSTDELRRIEQASRLPLPYPYWHQAKSIRNRLSAGDAALLGERP